MVSTPLVAMINAWLVTLPKNVPLPKMRPLLPLLTTNRELSLVPSDASANVPPNRLIDPRLFGFTPLLFQELTVRLNVNVAPLATRISPFAELLKPPKLNAFPEFRYNVPLVAMIVPPELTISLPPALPVLVE